MAGQWLDVLLTSATGAFLQVGVFVGGLLLLFGYINYRTTGGLIRAIERHRKWQPVIGALLGASPGCGGAIFVMPLFMRRIVTFGSLVATLVATMGDASFVVISKAPSRALIIHIVSFVLGVITGYVVDALGIGRGLIEAEAGAPSAAEDEAEDAGPAPIRGEATEGRVPHISHEAGDAVHEALHPPGEARPEDLGYKLVHQGYLFYWVVVVLGFIAGVVLLTQRSIDDWLPIRLEAAIGIAGTVVSILLMVASRHFLGDDTHHEHEEKQSSLRETFIHNASETAFTTTWVFVAYVAYGSLVLIIGPEHVEAAFLSAGLLAVIMGAIVGLVPGCGPQIVFVTLYCQGFVPFSAVLANAISQDGDALFPVLAMHRRTALLATVVTTVPALVIGVIAYFSGIDQLLALVPSPGAGP